MPNYDAVETHPSSVRCRFLGRSSSGSASGRGRTVIPCSFSMAFRTAIARFHASYSPYFLIEKDLLFFFRFASCHCATILSPHLETPVIPDLFAMDTCLL